MNKDFFELCYRQYRLEMEDADSLYQKAGVMLGLIPILAASNVFLGRLDLVPKIFTRVDVFLFYASAIVTWALLAACAVCVFLFTCPRKGYESLASLDVWHRWLEDYRSDLDAWADDGCGEQKETALEDGMLRSLSKALAAAEPVNAKINERRRSRFRLSVLLAALTVLAMSIQGIFAVLLKLQGV